MSSAASGSEVEDDDCRHKRGKHGKANEKPSGNEKYENRSSTRERSKKSTHERSRDNSRSRSRNRSRSQGRYRSRNSSSHSNHKRLSRDEMAPSHYEESPGVCHCLGVFGLSAFTEERDLKEVFTQYGPVDDIYIIYDRQSGKSKGFGFVYFKSTEDAIEARKGCQGMNLDGRPIRVDYSLTTHPHTPTPGRYMGKSSVQGFQRYNSNPRRDEYYEQSDYGGSQYERSHYRSRYSRDSYDENYREPGDFRRREPRYSTYSRHC